MVTKWSEIKASKTTTPIAAQAAAEAEARIRADAVNDVAAWLRDPSNIEEALRPALEAARDELVAPYQDFLRRIIQTLDQRYGESDYEINSAIAAARALLTDRAAPEVK